MKIIEFPKDFERRMHPFSGTQWMYKMPDDSPLIEETGIAAGQLLISIVGGGMGQYGDGVRTFEMYDFREPEPRAYMLQEEINVYLKENPIP